jgi:hypothetical protein
MPPRCIDHLLKTVPVLLIIPATAGAGPLQDLLSSKQMQKLEKRNSTASDLPSWVVPNSNYAHLFTTNGVNTLFEWMGSPDARYRPLNRVIHRPRGVVDVVQRYERDDNGMRFEVRFLLPRPGSIPLVQYKLIDQFLQLVPPLLPSDYERKVVIRGQPGMLYSKVGGACSINIPFDYEIMLAFRAPSCNDPEELVTFANSFDLARSKTKLSQ